MCRSAKRRSGRTRWRSRWTSSRARIAGVAARELAWSGRRSFDLDDDYDRSAAYKIVLEEGREEHFRRYLNARLLVLHWRRIRPARRVAVLWERRFPELVAAYRLGLTDRA